MRLKHLFTCILLHSILLPMDYNDENSTTYSYLPDGTLLSKEYGLKYIGRKGESNGVIGIASGADSVTTDVPSFSDPQIAERPSLIVFGKTEYSGNIIYKNGKLDKVLFPGGYCTFDSENNSQPIFHYFTQDHLGNNRTVTSEDGTVEQITHYYPFGGTFNDAGLNASLQQYKYNGKELDRVAGLNTYDYGARQYFSPVPTWDRMDALCEKYYNISPYAYCNNNPVNILDINGDSIQFTGSHNEINQTVKTLNVSTHNFASININSDGMLTMSLHDDFNINSLNRSEKELYKSLDKIINGSGIAMVNIVNNSPDVIVGNISNNTIDIGDICNMPTSAKMTSTSVLMHELYENYNVQTQNMDIKSAHEKSARLEGRITGYMLDPWNRLIKATGKNRIPVLFPQNEKEVIFNTKNGNIIK